MKTFQNTVLKGLCFAIFLIMCSISARSQEVIEVKNIQALMSKGTQPCYVVEIPKGDLDFIQGNWIKKLQEGGKLKVKKINTELVFAGAVKTELTADTVNIYTLFIQREEARVIMNVFVEINGSFFSPGGDKTIQDSERIDANLKNYLRTFAVDQYKLTTANQLKGEQDVLEELQDDLKKLVKNEENLEKENSNLENDIDESKRKSSEFERNLTLKNQEILAHNTSMLALVLEAEKKAALEKQKDLEKEKSQLEKSQSKEKDNISSCESKIKKNEKAIDDSKKQQEKTKEAILTQTDVVAKVQALFDGIK